MQPTEANALKKNLEALIQQVGNEFVRHFLGAVKFAGGVLVDPDLIAKLEGYP